MSTENELIPIDNMKIVTVDRQNPKNGLIFDRGGKGAFLVFDWSGEAHAMFLSGESQFSEFKMTPGVTLCGSFIEEPEIFIDPKSHFNARKEWEKLGSLVCKEGKAHIIAKTLGDSFGDPTATPIWKTVQTDYAGDEIGYSRWSLVVRDGMQITTIWQSWEDEPESEITENEPLSKA